MSAVRMAPGWTVALPTGNAQRSSKSGFPTSPAMSGLMTLSTSASTTIAKAPPMMTPTARSIALPREMKFLNPWIITGLLSVRARRARAGRD